MNQAERNEKIEEYGRGFDLFSAALAEAPREAWEFKPASGEWSIHEIIIHMKDSEIMGVTRLYKLIAEPGSSLMAYEEDKWADALDYQNQDVDDALQIFKLTTQTTYHLLKTLSDPIFRHSVEHPGAGYPEYGESYNLDKWLNIYTHHIPTHIDQLRKTYQVWQAQNR